MKTAVVLALLLAAASGPVAAQSLVPGPNQPGRYQMQPVPGGVARLDTVTGDVSLCRVEGGALRCRASEDTDAAATPPGDADGERSEAPAEREPGYSDDDSAQDDPGQGAETPREGAKRDDTDAELDKAIGRVKKVFRAFRDIAREFDHEERGGETAPDRT